MESHVPTRFNAFRDDAVARFYNMALVSSIVSVMESHPVVDRAVRFLAIVVQYTLFFTMLPVIVLLLSLFGGVITILLGWMYLLLLLVLPCSIPIGATILTAGLWYMVFKAVVSLVVMLYGLLHGPLSLQIHYIIESTPACVPIIRLWRSCLRNGFLKTFMSFASKISHSIAANSILVLQHVANEPAFFTNVIQRGMNLIFVPVIIFAKIAILVIWPLIAAWRIVKTTTNTVLDITGVVYSCFACFTGLLFVVFRSVMEKAIALFLLPQTIWLWVASLIVSEEVLNMGTGEILLEILRKIPVIGNIAVIQTTAASGVRRANDTMERIVYVRDGVTGELHRRGRAARDGIHFHLDSYVNLPREVLILLVRDYLVNGPMDRAKRWMEDNLEFPYLLQETAGMAITEASPGPNHHVTLHRVRKSKQRLSRSESESDASHSSRQNPRKPRRHSVPALMDTARH